MAQRTLPAPATGHRPAVAWLAVPRWLHPLAWWAWAVGLLVVANSTTNPLLLGLVLAVLSLVVSARRPQAAWAGAFTVSLRLGLIVIASRMLLQLVFNPPVGSHELVRLPAVHLPPWLAGIRLGGLVTWESLLVGFTEGLRLAAIIACIGAANSLAAPSRLLRRVPTALYELGVAIVVALSVTPNLLADARRVRSARRLRGFSEGRVRGFVRSAGPVLEGGLDRSLELAAAMDSRGYGRRGQASDGVRRLHTLLALVACGGALIGLYGLFDTAAPSWLGWPLLALSALVAAAALRSGGTRSARTSYRPDPWAIPEWGTAACGGLLVLVTFALPSASATTATVGAGTQVWAAWLALPPALLAALLVACLPAWLTPLPPGMPATAGRQP